MNKFTDKEGAIHFKLNNPYLPAIFASIILMIVGQIVTKGFLSINNFSSILMTTSILALVSMAQAAVVISGDMGLDMSVGSVMSLTALFGPMIMLQSNFLSMVDAIIAVILIGAVIGLINGVGVQYLKIVPLVMTLVMASVVSGLALFITKGQPSVSVSKTLQSISSVVVGPLRVLPLIVIVLFIILEVLMLKKSRYGRSLFLSGNNTNAANLSGINTRRVIILAYVFSGAVSGFAGLMLVGYAGSAQMHMADQYTMLSVASVVIGGTKLTGGKGSFVGGALGALVLILITNILQALNMPAGLRALIQGIILIGVLMINSRAPKLRE